MAIVASDWSITRATGNIRYIGDDHTVGTPSYATVLEFHRWLGDLSDDASSTGDDELAMSDLLPSNKQFDTIISLVNNYNIDANASEHLYDGSIIQNDGDDIYDGIVNFGNAGVVIQVAQNGAVLADDWWNDNSGLNADITKGISHRFMLLVRSAGADIDGRKLLGTTREFNKSYAEFSINGTSRGNNTLALKNSDDLNNATAIATVAGWASIVNLTEGYAPLDVNNNGVDEEYYSEWDLGTQSINDFYERMKWLTRDGSASTIYGLNGELFRGITHEIAIDTPTGTFNAFEAVSWTGGAGQMFAIDSTTAGTKMWIQLLTGDAPADNVVITGGTSIATATVNVTVTARSISSPFAGSSTGSSIVGSYGLGMQLADLTAKDKLTDLGGDLNVPPNNVQYNMNGLVVGEDSILIGPWDGVAVDPEGNPAIDKAQLILNTTLSGVAETAVVLTTAIPTDTPATGKINVILNSGNTKIVAYTSYTASTFTIASTDFSGDIATAANNVWIAYLSKVAAATSESFTSIYLADRNLVILARDGGVTPTKQFISSGLLSDTGGSITIIRTAD